MGRIFVTGDKHGDYDQLRDHLVKHQTNKQDVVIILGDHGTLYYDNGSIDRKKTILSKLPATFICLRGNHDRRPTCPIYNHKLIDIDTPTHAGQFYVDERYPDILYTKEYGWYRFGSHNVFVIGGAYSVDKYHRIKMQASGFTGYSWFSDEQLYPQERDKAEKELATHPEEFCIMSHTVPLKYIPVDQFLPSVDQKTVDNTMERWLDDIEDGLNYHKWYCGHWHINRSIDRIEFLYEAITLLDETEE